MEQEIIVFEAPPKEDVHKETSDEEKYTALGKLFSKAIVDAVRILDNNELDEHFDSTVPALMIHEIMRYFYPVWDRLDENASPKSQYAIKIPIRQPTYGYFITKKASLICKSIGSADVIGFKIPDILVPQHKYSNNPLWEEVIHNPPLCNPKYIILSGRYGNTPFISERRYFVQQTKDFPHISPYPGDVIVFNNKEHAELTMKNMLVYIDRLKTFYRESLSVYRAVTCGPFKRFINDFFGIDINTLAPEQSISNNHAKQDDIKQNNTKQDKQAKPNESNKQAKPNESIKQKQIKTITSHISTMLDLCACQLQDLGPKASTDLPLEKRDSWWLSLSTFRLTTLYILLITGSPMYKILYDKMQNDKHSQELSIKYATLMTTYKEIEAIKLSYARAKFGDIKKLSQLNKSQASIVDKEYESYVHMKDVPKEITKAIRKFQASLFGPLEILRETFGALRKLIKVDEKDVYEKYILCPHRVDLATSLLGGKSKKDAVEAIKLEYAAPDLLEYYGFFCSKCGEMIKRLDTDEMMEFIDFGDISQSQPLDDPLSALINKIVISICNHDITFTGITRLLRIVDYIVNIIRPKIAEMEKQMMKSKTTLIEHITDLLSIYIHIYAMAIITRMIALNPGSVQFVGYDYGDKHTSNKNAKDGGGDDEENDPNVSISTSKYIFKTDEPGVYDVDSRHGRSHSSCEYAGGKPRVPKSRSSSSHNQPKTLPIAELLAIAKRILMKNITVHMRKINAIKPEALTGLLVKAYQWAATLKETRKEDETTTYNILDALQTMSVYRYLRLAHFNKKNVEDVGPDKVLGRSIAELKAGNIDLFANTPVVEKWDHRTDLDPEALEYQYRSYLSEVRYVRNGIYRLVAGPDSEKAVELIQFEESFADLVKYERFRDWRRYLFELFPLCRPTIIDPKPSFYYNPAYRKLNYAQYYDKSGKPRKWSKYVYENKAGKQVIIDASEIQTRSLKPDFAELTFVDWADEDDEYSSVVDTNIEEMVKIQFSIKCLYEYYSSRCPEGDLHEMNESNHCTKCSIGKLTREAYFKKYKTNYNELISEQSNSENKILMSMNTRTSLQQQPKLAKWSSTPDIILKWSKITQTEFSKLNAIGLYWRFMEDDIKSGKSDPLDNVTSDDNMQRLSILKSYYLFIVRFYNSIKYDPMVNLSDANLEEIFKKHKDKITGLAASLHTINSNIVFLQLEIENDVEVACNFMLSTIANILLQIDTLPKYQAFGHDLCLYLTRRIITMEYMSTKPPPYSRASIKPVNPVVNQYDDTDDEVEDDMAEAFSDVEPAQQPIFEEQSEDTPPTDVFSFENSDITVANDGNDDGEDGAEEIV